MKNDGIARLTYILVMLLCAGLTVDAVWAGKVELIPQVQLRGEYDDNINLQRTQEDDDYLLTIGPALTYRYTTDQLRIDSQAGVDVRRYLDESDLDNEKITVNFGADYKAMERLGLSANFGYIKDTTLDSYLEEIGRVYEREDRELYTAGGGVTYNLTERLNSGLNYNFRLSEIDSERYDDYKAHTLSAFLGYKLKNEIDTLFLNPSYSQNDLDTKDVTSYSVKLAWERRYSEMYKVRVAVGERFTTQEFDSTGREEDSNGMVADVSLTRTGEVNTISMGYTRDLAVGTQGDLQEVDKLYARFSHRLLERLSVNLAGSLILSTEENDRINDNDSTYYTLSPSVSYRLAENYFLSVGYTYSHIEEDLYEDSASRNVVWLGLTLQWPQIL